MKLLLVDGHYFAYRSFFAIRNLSNSRGEPTNAVFGFVKAVRRMLGDLAPDRAAVVWDEGLPQRRTEIQPEYKQQREEMPEDLVPQLGRIQAVIEAMGIKNLSLPDTEADDLMACYALDAVGRDMRVVLSTNDKDLFQMVRPGIAIYSTAKADIKDSSAGYALLGEEAVKEKWDVAPERILDVLALTGDSSDNIPGIQGVGKKTAAKLVNQFGEIEGIISNADGIGNEKLRAKIKENEEQIRQNLEMVRLDLDLQLPVPVDGLKIVPDYDNLIKEIDALEFKTLSRQVREEAAAAGNASQGELFP